MLVNINSILTAFWIFSVYICAKTWLVFHCLKMGHAQGKKRIERWRRFGTHTALNTYLPYLSRASGIMSKLVAVCLWGTVMLLVFEMQVGHWRRHQNHVLGTEWFVGRLNLRQLFYTVEISLNMCYLQELSKFRSCSIRVWFSDTTNLIVGTLVPPRRGITCLRWKLSKEWACSSAWRP